MPESRCEIVRAIMKHMPMSKELCLRCKGGRLLCGRPACPLLAKLMVRAPVEAKLGESIFGPSPGIFVGWKGYPKVLAGPLTAVDEELAGVCDNPGEWYGLSVDEIVRLRSVLVRSKAQVHVRSTSKIAELSREIALAQQPPDTEVRFERKPSFSISFSPFTQPLGPSAPVRKVELAENPRIPAKVDSVAGDELSSTQALKLLYDSGYDVYYLTKVLSSGALGYRESRRMVPTRWSITAVDDTLGREVLKEVREYRVVSEYRVYRSTYLDNHFEILLMPRRWEYEMFEGWAPKTLWTMHMDTPAINAEHEGYHGRSDYAESEGGAYYAARLGVLEALRRMRRQAGVVVFREIYEGYIIPVGVWEVRENVRRAMSSEPERFQSLGEALSSISERLRIPLREYLKRSALLQQRRLDEF